MLFITSCYVDKMDIFVNASLLMHARRQFFHYFKLTEKSFVKKNTVTAKQRNIRRAFAKSG